MPADDVLERLRANLARTILGKDREIDLLLTALAAGGHVLLEDVPGVGKTVLARALALSIGGVFRRLQFTPDLLPADITGTAVWNPGDGSFTFQPGPVFAHVVLADEINRASPRTQSALLEAMSEGQVSVEGRSHALPAPFFVVATENPVEFHGTFPLPEAQLDRFLMRLSLGYPDPGAELEMLFAQERAHPLDALSPVASPEEVALLRERVRSVGVSRPLAQYLVDIAAASRTHRDIALGISPRGTLALFRAIQARALLQGRAFATPDDAKAVAEPVLAHRVHISPQARHSGRTGAAVVRDILGTVPVPV